MVSLARRRDNLGHDDDAVADIALIRMSYRGLRRRSPPEIVHCRHPVGSEALGSWERIT